jgi:hypothetical protein
MYRAILAVIGLATSACAFSFAADDTDPIKMRLEQARKDLDTNLAKARAGTLTLFDRKIDAAQTAGDLATLKKVRAERDAFAERGDGPTTISVTDYQQAMRKAREQFTNALAQARKEFTQAGKITEAEAVDRELEAFKKGPSTRPRDSLETKPRPEPPSVLLKARDDLAMRLAGTQWRWGGTKTLAFHADGTASYGTETLAWVAVDGQSILVFYPSNKNWDRMTFDDKLTQVSKEWIGAQERKAVTTSVRIK